MLKYFYATSVIRNAPFIDYQKLADSLFEDVEYVGNFNHVNFDFPNRNIVANIPVFKFPIKYWYRLNCEGIITPDKTSMYVKSLFPDHKPALLAQSNALSEMNIRVEDFDKMLSGFYPITNNSMLETTLNADYNTKLQSMRTDYYKHYMNTFDANSNLFLFSLVSNKTSNKYYFKAKAFKADGIDLITRDSLRSIDSIPYDVQHFQYNYLITLQQYIDFKNQNDYQHSSVEVDELNYALYLRENNINSDAYFLTDCLLKSRVFEHIIWQKNNGKLELKLIDTTNNPFWIKLIDEINKRDTHSLKALRNAIVEVIALHSNYNKVQVLYMLSLVWNPKLDFESQKEEL